MNTDTYQAMLAAAQAFHDKHRFKPTGGEDWVYRVALMAEEWGEISACVTKGSDAVHPAEECADLMTLLMGTAIAADLDLKRACWSKMKQLDRRGGRFVKGRIRVSDFD